jgi:hypothetical protein
MQFQNVAPDEELLPEPSHPWLDLLVYRLN